VKAEHRQQLSEEDLKKSEEEKRSLYLGEAAKLRWPLKTIRVKHCMG